MVSFMADRKGRLCAEGRTNKRALLKPGPILSCIFQLDRWFPDSSATLVLNLIFSNVLVRCMYVLSRGTKLDKTENPRQNLNTQS